MTITANVTGPGSGITGLSGGGGGGSSALTINTTTVTGGVAGNFLYTDGALLQASTGITWNATGQMTVALGTITANAQALNITGTWNNAGVNFVAPLLINITNTASGSASSLLTLQEGGVQQFAFAPSSNPTTLPALYMGSSNTVGGNSFILAMNGGTAILNGGAINLSINNGSTYFGVQSQGAYVLASAGLSLTNTRDITLYRDGAANLAAFADQALGTTAVGLRVYNTTDNAATGTAPTNYERGIFDWTTNTNTLTIGSEKGGTGTLRNVQIQAGANNAWTFQASSAALIIPGSNAAYNFDGFGGIKFFTDTGLSRASAGVVAVGNGTAGDASGTLNAAVASLVNGTVTASTKVLNITQTWNNAAVAFDAPLFMNITDTASAFNSALFDLNAGAAYFRFYPHSVSSTIALLDARSNSVGSWILSANNSWIAGLDGGAQFSLLGGKTLGWATGNDPGITDVGLTRTAAHIIGVNDPGSLTTATGLQIYNTTDSNTAPTNYERGVIDWTTTANVLTIGTQKGGTGSTRTAQWVIGGNITDNIGTAPITDTAATYSVLATDKYLIFNGSAQITVTLPAASSSTGRELWLKTIAAQTVISASSNVVPVASATAGTAILAATAGKYAVLVSDGTNWITMNAN